MWLLVLCRLICELMFYYMTAGLFSILLKAGPNIAAFPLVCVLAAFLCWLLRDKKALRFLPLALILSLIPLAKLPIDVVFLIPAAALTAVKVIKQDWYTTHIKFYPFFIKGLAATAAAMLFILISPVLRQNINTAALFILGYLFSGVMACRLLRHESALSSDRKFRLLNAFFLLMMSGAALALSSRAVLRAMGAALRFVYSWTLLPLLKGMAYIGYALAWLLSKIHINIKGDLDRVYESIDELSDLPQRAEEGAIRTLDLGWLLKLLTVAALVMIVVVIFKKIKGSAAHAPASVRESRQRLPFTPGEKKKRIFALSRSPRDRVRLSWRRFLSELDKAGGNVPPHYSTLETALEARERMEPEGEIEELRALYLGARYREREDVPVRDAERAKKLSKSIKQK